jgi:hypothetical protein
VAAEPGVSAYLRDKTDALVPTWRQLQGSRGSPKPILDHAPFTVHHLLPAAGHIPPEYCVPVAAPKHAPSSRISLQHSFTKSRGRRSQQLNVLPAPAMRASPPHTLCPSQVASDGRPTPHLRPLSTSFRQSSRGACGSSGPELRAASMS